MANALILNNGNVIAGVTVSAKKTENHSFVSQATETPIENGSIITDHVILKPVEVTVTFMVENSFNQFTDPFTVFESLYDLWNSRTLVELVTEHAIYKNMVVTEFTPLHQAPFKGALDCNLKLRKISKVNIQFIKLSKPKSKSNSVDKTAAPPVQAGKVAPKPTTALKLFNALVK